MVITQTSAFQVPQMQYTGKVLCQTDRQTDRHTDTVERDSANLCCTGRLQSLCCYISAMACISMLLP